MPNLLDEDTREYVVCRLCGRHLRVINFSHLKTYHGIPTWRYYEMFPGAPLICEERREEIGKCASESNSGRTWPEEQRDYISNLFQGHEVSETTREAISRAQRGYWADPDWASKRREQLSDPGRCERIRQEVTERWAYPSYKDRVVAAMVEGNMRRPNKDELQLGAVLSRCSPGKWLYNGDGRERVVIGGCVPDFVSVDGRSLVIELFGGYHHGPTMTDKTEEDKIGHYRKFGYECLVLWDDEVWNAKKVPETVRQFEDDHARLKG